MPPSGEIIKFTIVDEIRRPQTGVPSKIICLEKVLFDDGREEVRLGYYIIGKLPRMKGKWVWGQFATLLPLRDFRYLIRRARISGWID
jgi:hypothetical protein